MSGNRLTIKLPPLSDEAVAAILETIEELHDNFERQYFGQLHRHYRDIEQRRRQRLPSPFDAPNDDDPPF